MNKKEKKHNNSLGFIYGFKESSKKEKSIKVSLICGISKKYPKEFEKNKDFFTEEIFEGDYFELFYNNIDYIESFTKEINEILNNSDFYSELFEQRKHYYLNTPNKEQYFSLIAFDYAALNFICKSFENDGQLSDVLQKTVGQFYENPNSEILISLHEEHRGIGEYIYNKELSNLSNSFKQK